MKARLFGSICASCGADDWREAQPTHAARSRHALSSSNTLQDTSVRAKTSCYGTILMHPPQQDLTIVSMVLQIQILRRGSSGLMEGCALRKGQINAHRAVEVRGSPAAPWQRNFHFVRNVDD